MPVLTTENTKQYSVGPAEVDFQFPYMIINPATDLTVKMRHETLGTITTLAYGIDYSVAALDNDYTNGCTVTTNVAWGIDYEITIERNLPLTQPTDMERGQALDPEVLDLVHDRLLIQMQQVFADVERSLRIPITDPLGLDMTIPAKADRLSNYLAFDTDGKPIAAAGSVPSGIVVTPYMETVLDDPDAPTAQTTLDVYPKASLYTKSEVDALIWSLPIGTVLMFNGTGIQDADTRTAKLGDLGGDTITPLPLGDWYVCNGNSSTPDLSDSFIRSESASGNTGGSDDAIVVTHGHGKTANQDTSHAHQYYTYVHASNQNLRNEPASYSGAYCARYRQSRNTGNQNSSHKHTVNDAGASGTDKNMPVYYSLIHIVRMA